MNDIVGQEPTISYLNGCLANPPHIILWGPTGIGKTMIANAWISRYLDTQGILNPSDKSSMILRLNSADDRGINAIRQKLTEFVRSVRPIKDALAWILIDDADNLPIVTQQALRRILEIHAHQCRFCFIAQSPEHFIEPIQSRCVILQCFPVSLYDHGETIQKREAPNLIFDEDANQLMVSMCNSNVRQYSLICRMLKISGTVHVTKLCVQTLVNIPPVPLLLRLQSAIISRDLNRVTEYVLSLWSRGYSFEDCIAMLELVVRLYNDTINDDLHYVLQVCAEGHIFQILNKMTTLDLIAVLSGKAASTCLA
jgi:replication factor C small subunit